MGRLSNHYGISADSIRRSRAWIRPISGYAAPNTEAGWFASRVESEEYKTRIDHLGKTGAAVKFLSREPLIGDLGELNLKNIDWEIVGGESGPGARPMRAEWVINIQHQCESSRVPFFFKQSGGVQKKRAGRNLGGRTYDEMPAATQAFVIL